LEITHVVTPVPKRKRNPYGGNSQDPGGLETKVTDMEVDEVNDVPTWVVVQIAESKLIAEELAQEGPTIFEEESVTLHHAKYDKQSRKLQIERVNLKDKRVTRKWSSEIEVKGLRPSRVLIFHQAMGEALAHSITEQELENTKLKKRIRELKVSLSPKPLFAEPLSMIVPG
jgi:hypothetical protein